MPHTFAEGEARRTQHKQDGSGDGDLALPGIELEAVYGDAGPPCSFARLRRVCSRAGEGLSSYANLL